MHITFIQAGGTIDKDYPRGADNHGYAFWVRDPAVRSILPGAHVQFTYDIVEAAKKDSLDLTDEDRQKIVEAVRGAQSDRIVITHGSDTLIKTAKLLSKEVSGKTIVFTGALFPEKFMDSDARFNVGMAVATAQLNGPGVYVALYGHVVPWDQFDALPSPFEAKLT